MKSTRTPDPTDPRSRVLTLYDPRGGVLTLHDPRGGVLTLSDPRGGVLTLSDTRSGVLIVFDPRGRLLTLSDPRSGMLALTDPRGGVLTSTNPHKISKKGVMTQRADEHSYSTLGPRLVQCERDEIRCAWHNLLSIRCRSVLERVMKFTSIHTLCL